MADLFMATENHVFTVNVSPTVSTIPYTIEIIRENNQEVFARSENNTGNSSLSIEIFTDPNSPFSPTGNRLNRVDLHNFATQIFTNGRNRFYARISCKVQI